MASELALISAKIFLRVFLPGTRTGTLEKGLEAWDPFVVGEQFAPTTSALSLSVRVDHRKHPLTSTSCHPRALAKQFTGCDFSSLVTVISPHL
ncbi:hypothetical protein PoB_000389400 [Plakobranchus ocellatus]|uniref:Secreted protein n=1 Tax=Plakobranchus ocellatus TaxID=259542 RepID=A0AAV3Y588_9GAST|nr:hypothetical protein PoB_000389400 [Plakobranchus ocellatus]